MNNIVVTIELSAEDRARLDGIQQKLDKLLIAPVALDMPQEQLKQAEPSNITPEPEKPKEEPKTETPEASKPSITNEQLQQKVVQLAASGSDKKAKVREIINRYAAKVSAIPEDKLAEVWQQLTALESEG